MVGEILRVTAAAVLDGRPAALADEPDAVHQHRTSVRRLRSVLAALRPLLDAPAAERIRVLYAEWGGQLGVVRDAEVRGDVAADALRSHDIDAGSAWTRLVEEERIAHGRAHARLTELAASPRAVAAERQLRAFVAGAEIVDGDAPARTRLRPILAHEAKRVRRAHKHLDGSVERLHAVRKAGRRLRYVAEAVHAAAPDLFGDDLVALAKAGESVHDVLGAQRDAVIFAERVRLERARAARGGEPVQPYDALIADAEASAARGLARLDDALSGVRSAAAFLGGRGSDRTHARRHG